MLSNIPIKNDDLGVDTIDKSILRHCIIGEMDAVNLYEQFADMSDDENLQKVLLDIAREEKTHIGEFLALLKLIDAEQAEELEHGADEVSELLE